MDSPEPRVQEFDNMFRVELFRGVVNVEKVGTSQKGKWIIRKADYNHVQKNEKI